MLWGTSRTFVKVSPCATMPDLLDVVRSPVRLEILARLAESPKDVSSLSKEMNLEIQAVSHHLRPLLKTGLVEFEQVKQNHVYRLSERVTTFARGEKLHLQIATSDGNELELRLVLKSAAVSPKLPGHWSVRVASTGDTGVVRFRSPVPKRR